MKNITELYNLLFIEIHKMICAGKSDEDIFIELEDFVLNRKAEYAPDGVMGASTFLEHSVGLFTKYQFGIRAFAISNLVNCRFCWKSHSIDRFCRLADVLMRDGYSEIKATLI